MTKKLLLADDSLTIQKVIGIIFANEDYELAVADNGDAALDQASQIKPDLVMADVNMPGKDGFQLCEALRQTPGLEQTPVLLLPGAFELFDEDRAQAVGASAWLNKPFESQVLLEKVEELLAAVPAESAPAPQAVAEEPVLTELPVVDESPFVQDAPEAEAETEEDIWGSFSFEEDEPEPVTSVAEAESPDVTPQETSTLTSPFEEDVVTEDSALFEEAEPSVAGAGEVLELADDDIFELEDNERIESPASAPNTVSSPMEDISFDEPLTVDAPAENADVELPVADEPFAFSDSATEADTGFDEPAPFVTAPSPEPDPFAELNAELEAAPSSEVKAGVEDASSPEPAPESATGTEQLEQQLRDLPEEDLRAVVEKVATPVVEKLAAEMLERVVWEVVPDLAENMIREEIRKIKEGTE